MEMNMNLPPLDPRVFELTAVEQQGLEELENCKDIESLRRVAMGMYCQGIKDAKMCRLLMGLPVLNKVEQTREDLIKNFKVIDS